jgi:hypothetical protein
MKKIWIISQAYHLGLLRLVSWFYHGNTFISFIRIVLIGIIRVELDVNELDEIRSKLKNIREIRQNKVREGIQAVDQNYLQVKL